MPIERQSTFRELLVGSGLLESSQIRALNKDPVLSTLDSRTLAQHIVQRGWLTRFQIKKILLGETRDLTFGKYLLQDRLGEGGMGQVFKALHRPMNRVEALKLIRKERLSKPSAVERFKREVQLAGQLFHPNIVLAFNIGEVDGTHFFAMEYVDGTDLARVVHKNGPLSVAQACEYIRQTALGLQHAQQRGLVHRDIKPSNLLVTRALGPDGVPVVKILDMGLARLDGFMQEPQRPTTSTVTGGSSDDADPSLTRAGQLVGTPDFLAPEQARNPSGVDIRADLYSLGCSFYFLLAGKVPFPSETLEDLLMKHARAEPQPLTNQRPDVPPAVVAVIRKLMAKKPEDRFQTPGELIQVLEPLCKAMPLQAPAPALERVEPDLEFAFQQLPNGGNDRTTASFSRDAVVETERPARRWWVLFAALMLGAVLGGGLRLAFSRREAPTTDPGKNQPSVTQTPVATPPVPVPPQPVAKVPDATPPIVPPKPPVAMLVGPLRPFEGHLGIIRCLAVSPDGRFAATGADDRTVRVWRIADGAEMHCFRGHTGTPLAVCFTPDGTGVISAGADQTIRHWDRATEEQLRLIAQRPGPVATLAISPDGARLASSGGTLRSDEGKTVPVGCEVVLQDLRTGQELQRLTKASMPVRSVAFSPDGSLLLSGGTDGRLRLQDAFTGALIREFSGSPLPVEQVGFLAGGKQAVALHIDQMLHVWDVDSGKDLRRIPGLRDLPNCMAVNNAGTRALVATSDTEKKENQIVIAPDGRPVYVRCMLRYFDLEAGKYLGRFEGHTDQILTIAFLPDGQRALAAGAERILRVHELAMPLPPEPMPTTPPPITIPPAPIVNQKPFTGHTGSVTNVTISLDGKRAATTGEDATVRIWEMPSGKQIKSITLPAAARCLAFSPSGRRLVTGDGRGLVMVHEIDKEDPPRTISFGQAAIEYVTFGPDGRRVGVASGDGYVRVWIVDGQDAGTIPRTLGSPNQPIVAAAISPDGQFVAYALQNQTVKLANLDTGKETGVFLSKTQIGKIESMVFSGNGNYVITGGADRLARVWRWQTGQELRRTPLHPKAVTAVASTGDGNHVLTGCADHQVRLFELVAGTVRLVRTFEGHKEPVKGVALTPNGRYALSVAEGILLHDFSKIPGAPRSAGSTP